MHVRPDSFTTVLYVPAHSDRHLRWAIASDVPAVILDLEDGVEEHDKLAARSSVAPAVAQLTRAGRHVTLRINAIDTSWWPGDLDAALVASPDAIQLPKAGRVEVMELTRALAARESRIPVWAMVERVRDALSVHEVASVRGVTALVIGVGDLCKELDLPAGSQHPELVGVRRLVASAAQDHDLVAFDGVHIGDVKSAFDAGTQSRSAGLTGRTLYDARHVAGVSAAYAT